MVCFLSSLLVIQFVLSLLLAFFRLCLRYRVWFENNELGSKHFGEVVLSYVAQSIHSWSPAWATRVVDDDEEWYCFVVMASLWKGIHCLSCFRSGWERTMGLLSRSSRSCMAILS